jgi:hypothetical protein
MVRVNSSLEFSNGVIFEEISLLGFKIPLYQKVGKTAYLPNGPNKIALHGKLL